MIFVLKGASYTTGTLGQIEVPADSSSAATINEEISLVQDFLAFDLTSSTIQAFNTFITYLKGTAYWENIDCIYCPRLFSDITYMGYNFRTGANDGYTTNKCGNLTLSDGILSITTTSTNSGQARSVVIGNTSQIEVNGTWFMRNFLNYEKLFNEQSFTIGWTFQEPYGSETAPNVSIYGPDGATGTGNVGILPMGGTNGVASYYISESVFGSYSSRDAIQIGNSCVPFFHQFDDITDLTTGDTVVYNEYIKTKTIRYGSNWQTFIDKGLYNTRHVMTVDANYFGSIPSGTTIDFDISKSIYVSGINGVLTSIQWQALLSRAKTLINAL